FEGAKMVKQRSKRFFGLFMVILLGVAVACTDSDPTPISIQETPATPPVTVIGNDQEPPVVTTQVTTVTPDSEIVQPPAPATPTIAPTPPPVPDATRPAAPPITSPPTPPTIICQDGSRVVQSEYEALLALPPPANSSAADNSFAWLIAECTNQHVISISWHH